MKTRDRRSYRHVRGARKRRQSSAQHSLPDLVARTMEKRENSPRSDAETKAVLAPPSFEDTSLLADLREIPSRMSVSAAAVLGLLRSLKQSTPTELSLALGVSPAAMTGTADTLEGLGLVIRREDTGDRRRVVLALTSEGGLLAERIFPPD